MQNNATNFLNYRISGNGDPVLFLHGFMEDCSMWDHILSELPVRAIAIDLPGHGKSTIPEQQASIQLMAEKVMEIVRLEGLESAQIIGHSLGGYVALELMKLNPTFEHATLFHSHPWEDSASKKEDRNRVIELGKEKSSYFIREAIPNLFCDKSLLQTMNHYISIAQKMQPEAIAWAAKAMRDRNDNASFMVNNTSKFTIIQGEFDALIPRASTYEFCKTSNINYIEIPSCGHMAHEEQFTKTLNAFKTILINQ